MLRPYTISLFPAWCHRVKVKFKVVASRSKTRCQGHSLSSLLTASTYCRPTAPTVDHMKSPRRREIHLYSADMHDHRRLELNRKWKITCRRSPNRSVYTSCRWRHSTTGTGTGTGVSSSVTACCSLGRSTASRSCPADPSIGCSGDRRSPEVQGPHPVRRNWATSRSRRDRICGLRCLFSASKRLGRNCHRRPV